MKDNGNRNRRQAGAASSKENAAAKADFVEMLRSQARDIVYRTPEVRAEKVSQLKEAIEQGAYEVDSRKLADIIIKEWFPKR